MISCEARPMHIKRLNIAIGIATVGRPDILSETIDRIARQTRLPDRFVICPATESDLNRSRMQHFPVSISVVLGAIGSSVQRNQIIAAVAGDADVIVFFDDDFFPCNDYLLQIEQIFASHGDVAAVTGRPIEDGIGGPGLGIEYARSIADRPAERIASDEVLLETLGTYGCNMAFRMAPIVEHAIRFDEHLPLYGWLEDIDFSNRLAKYGRIVESGRLKGVHLGTKSARASGVRLGYSQIANPIYLLRKGTMPWSYARTFMLRNLVANFLRCLRPEPWIDRRGRLKGNFLALYDAVTGKVSPQRILDL
jgi:GT2 family glycosyltransferase